MSYLVPLAIGIIFGLFKLFVPHERRDDIDEERLVKNEKKFALFESLAIFPLFIFIGIIVYCVYESGNSLSNIYHSNIDENDIIYPAPPLMWFFPASLLGFGLVMIPMERLYLFLLKDDYKLYLEYTNRKHGWDGMKIMKPFAKVLTVLGITATFLVLNNYLILSEKQIISNELFSISESKTDWNRIDKIISFKKLIAPNGNIVDREQIVMYSEGKEIWIITPSFFDDNRTEMNLFVSDILNRTNLAIEEGDVYK